MVWFSSLVSVSPRCLDCRSKRLYCRCSTFFMRRLRYLQLMKWTDRRNIIILHVSFWVIFTLFKVFDYANDIPNNVAVRLVVCLHLFSLLGAYAHYFFLLPLLFQRKKVIYAIGLILLLSLCILGRGSLESTYLSGVFQTTYYSEWTLARISSMVWNLASFIVFISLIKFTVDRFVLESQKKELENEKLNAELNYLKAQINPHFLFNTLHNLNYLSEIKSDQATEVIVKLSNIMRYMIYETSKQKVPLAKEIGYIEDYLDLESIRLNKAFKLIFDTSGVDQQTEIAPLIFIPFVENAFKHGISDQQNSSWIQIHLKSQEGVLEFKVENSLKQMLIEKGEASGFGLENIKRRLKLSYPDRHQLQINQYEDKFSIHLILNLS